MKLIYIFGLKQKIKIFVFVLNKNFIKTFQQQQKQKSRPIRQ